MADVNLSVFLHGPGDLRLEDRDVPQPANNEVLLSVRYVGLCGTDIHSWRAGHGPLPGPDSPCILGHEYSATVEKVGPGVTWLQQGDRVAVEHPVPCSRCPPCRSGRYSLCSHLRFNGTHPDHGALTRQRVHPADWCHKLPPNVSDQQGALVEPLAVAVHACRRAGVQLGHRVLVGGAGTIGLCVVMAARAAGASEVCVTDIHQERLAVARELGATCTVLSETSSHVTAEKIMTELRTQPEVVIECSGVQHSLQCAIEAVSPGGVVVLVGTGNRMAEVPVLDITMKEVDVRGSFSYYNCYSVAISLVASGAANVIRIVTHSFRLEDTPKAFSVAEGNNITGAIKVLINCSRQDQST